MISVLFMYNSQMFGLMFFVRQFVGRFFGLISLSIFLDTYSFGWFFGQFLWQFLGWFCFTFLDAFDLDTKIVWFINSKNCMFRLRQPKWGNLIMKVTKLSVRPYVRFVRAQLMTMIVSSVLFNFTLKFENKPKTQHLTCFELWLESYVQSVQLKSEKIWPPTLK